MEMMEIQFETLGLYDIRKETVNEHTKSADYSVPGVGFETCYLHYTIVGDIKPKHIMF